MKSTLFFFAMAFLFLACDNEKNRPDDRPNILFIMSDDHTSQAWGIYGGVLEAYVKNEHIKRLASEGTVLENVFCTNSICVPSRGSILTGQYSHQNDIYTLSESLEPDSANIAKVLQSSGYETAVIGKWHLKKEPTGFDHYMVLPGQGVYHNPTLKTAENWEDANKGGQQYEGFSADVIGDFSVEWLKNREKKEQPFFLMCHFKATHEPFDYPARHEGLNEGVDIPMPSSIYDFDPSTNGRSFIGQKLEILGGRWEHWSKDSSTYHRYPGLPFSLEGLGEAEKRKAIYQKFVKDFMRSGAAIDDNIGKLLDYLDASGLSENTVVIYTSDQGYFLGEHGFFDKRMIYEEALRMPFVIRYPKEIKAGSRIDDLILNIDFPALFAEYAGVPKPDFVEGRGFRSNLKGESPDDWRESMYYRYWLHLDVRPAHFGIRNERYKLAFFYGQPLDKPGAMNKPTLPAWEFYDLEKDPGENYNAYNDPAYAEIIKELKVELLTHRNQLGDTDADFPIMQQIIAKNW